MPVEFWPTTYVHYVKGAEGIIESMRETSLAPFLEPLQAQSAQFLIQRLGDNFMLGGDRTPLIVGVVVVEVVVLEVFLR